MVNGYHVIDAHCHIYPDKIASRAVEGTSRFYDVHSHCDGTVSDLLGKGDIAGIDRFVVQSVATTPHQVESINEFIAKTVNDSNGRMIGLGTLHPDSTDLAGDVKKIISLGLKGVKLHPDIQQFKIDDYRCLKIYELCEQEKLPILMHTGDSRFDYSNPNRMLPIMEIYTELTVIGAHLGGWSVWNEAMEKLVGLPNFYVDCSSCFPFIGTEETKKVISAYGIDRVIFGTDYPMWKPDEELKAFFSLGFTEEENRKILSENVLKIFSENK